MTISLKRVLTFLLAALPAVAAAAQSLPATQPALLRIIREEVKLGRNADHARFEAGWPAAYERAKSPDYYLAMESLTGANEAWYVTPGASYKALGEAMTREEEPALAAELARLQRGDAEFVNSVRVIEARARPELSFGAYPDLAKQRFWQITFFRMRPGSEEAFAAAVKSYAAASGRAGNAMGYRVYEVVAGMPEPTYIVFSSVSGFADFDRMMAAGDATMKAMTADDQPIGKKFNEGLINSESFRFKLSPSMSYVPKETRATDPAFWMPKKPAPAKASSTAAAPAKPSGQ